MGFNSGTSTFRKEFKISGVVGGKTEQRVEYISLLSQIGEGKKKGYGDEEIALQVGHFFTNIRTEITQKCISILSFLGIG